MKPSHRVDRTVEDESVWWGLMSRSSLFGPPGRKLLSISAEADRRDAALMLEAQSDKTASVVALRNGSAQFTGVVHVRGIGDGWCPL